MVVELVAVDKVVCRRMGSGSGWVGVVSIERGD
jgi:hypothetical protein